ncbi:MAG: hypothetical protein IJA32_00010 [Lachnospiraceae bacterium]|nr:hypothetical protein [Lachnospiraceae bacterium]
MLRVTVGNIFTYLNYAVAVDEKLIVLSAFNNNEMSIKGMCANIGLNGNPVRILDEDRIHASFGGRLEMEHYHTKLSSGRENIYHSVSFSNLINQEYVFLNKDNREDDVYSYLMNQFDYPLLREWISYICKTAEEKGLFVKREMKIIGDCVDFEKYEVFQTAMTNEELQKILEIGLSQKHICIAKEKQNALQFQNMDDYFEKYGHTLVDNLEKLLKPLSPMEDKVKSLAFIEKSPFPQQAAIINGAVKCLQHKDYVLLIESMGAGKTLQAMGVAEAYFNEQYLKAHPDKNIIDVYKDGSLVNYRVIIMCPPHLVEKWAQSLRDEIPYAKVVILESLEQLVALRKEGKDPKGKQFYVLSKDSGKLSYSYAPVPYQIKRKKPKIPVCANCGKEYPVDDEICQCGCDTWVLEEQGKVETGLVCPECGELLLPVDSRKIYDPDLGGYRVLKPEDFAQQSTMNRFCRCCKTALWTPACENIDHRIMFYKPKPKPKRWKKISHFTNKAKKARKSVWVLASKEAEYKLLNGIDDEDVEDMDYNGPRRFGLTRYIKKYLKGYFDMAIFDEVQEYKAGGSAQGYSMHDLIKASKKHVALTGTIAGGYASDLFYTLYRLDPARMKSKGYSYGSKGERHFVEQYGTVETVYEVIENTQYHASSRGRVITPQRCLPGISVLIFTEFLMDTALFLDLSDLSRYLPNLYEEVVIVPLENEIHAEYARVRKTLKKEMTQGKDPMLMGSFLQFSLSYTDLPYNREPIKSPQTGEVVSSPSDLSYLVAGQKLLNKEQALVDMICKEQEENRNVFIYCEYTGDGEGTITYRLKDVIEEHCHLKGHEVVVLESSYPAASKREQWMHQKASEGAKVFITNAKCVATGLDFAFTHKGKKYNYPTIIFYQTGYDMIKIWQASRRAYRLNQTEDCKTFFMVSERTIQLDAVELVATKEVATSAIQGQFSSEGLSTMARGVDPRVVLAQAVAEKSEQKERGLRKMMDVLNQRNNQGKGEVHYEKMPTFSQLTGLKEVPNLDDPWGEFEWLTGEDVLDLLDMGTSFVEEEPIVEILETVVRDESLNTIIETEEQEEISGSESKSELEMLLDFLF